MDLYTFLLVLGGAGLVIMALQGLGGAHFGGHGAHAHAGHGGHAGHGHAGDGHAVSHSHSHVGSGASRFLWSFASPRVWFSVAMGTGLAGHLMRPVMGGGAFLLAA